MQTIKITTSQNIDIDYQLADLGDRILARLLDYAVFAGISLVILMILGVFSGLFNYYNNNDTNIGLYIMIGVWLLSCVLYDLICEIFFNGQSIGKRTMKIKVISLNGARPRVGQYLLRWVFRIIDFGITGGSLAVITVALSGKKQRVGDMVADTAVVNLTTKNTFGQLVFGPPPADYQPVYNQVALLTDSDVVVIYDVIKNFNHTRNSMLIYKLAMKIKSYLNVSYPREINEYQFLEIVLNDYKTITAKIEA